MFDLVADLVDQILRHALFQRAAAHHQGHGAGVVGEEHRRLAGGVAGADQVDVLALGDAGLAAGGAVVDALADQPVEALDGDPAPVDAGGEDDGAGVDRLVAVEVDGAGRGIDRAWSGG